MKDPKAILGNTRTRNTGIDLVKCKTMLEMHNYFGYQKDVVSHIFE